MVDLAFSDREGFPGGGTVEGVDGSLGRRGGGVVGGFGIDVAELCSVAGGFGGPEGAGSVSVEGLQLRVFIDVLPGGEDGGAKFQLVLGGHPFVGVDSLPDGEKAVDVVVMKPEYRVECCIVNLDVCQLG